MFSDGIIPLVESGVISGRRKSLHPGKAVTSFCLGTRKLYDFVHDNPYFEFLPTEFVNDPWVIAKNDRMISVNSALQVDLTGQVCADSLGSRFYSGIGGQVDFIRGAARSPGGRSIIALPSTAKDGTLSRIVPVLSEGSGVVTTRGDVHTVVTEFGVAELKGRTVRERALALVGVAHPKFRAELLDAAKGRRFVPPDQAPWPERGMPYPAELEGREPFRGREVLFRPIKASDERLLRDLFYSHSAETVRQRYHAPLKSLPAQQIQEYCAVDHDRHVALVGLAREGDADRMVAVARSILDPATGWAEVAFAVHDDWQGLGIGTSLFRRIRDAAAARGAKGFVAYVLAGNFRMLHIFHRSGLPVTSTLEDGIYTVRLPFGEA
jgi:GNAT superfamily N-acetyltransferase